MCTNLPVSPFDLVQLGLDQDDEGRAHHTGLPTAWTPRDYGRIVRPCYKRGSERAHSDSRALLFAFSHVVLHVYVRVYLHVFVCD